MVKVYYEEAQTSKHGRPGENVVGTSSGTAWKREPQAFAGMRSVEIVDTPEDGTPKGTAQVDVKDESNSEGTTNKDLEDYTSSSDDFITKHDGFKNTYTFEKDITTIVLVPSDLKKEMKNHFLSRAEFLTEVNETTNVFAIVVMDSNDGGDDVPHQLAPIIEEFTDVFPNKLPPGLPPMRDIQHCIDFIPGVVIPHKGAYRMNPKEHEELQKQV
ncbi:hypothetical protein Tco_0484011 [Tanacetum coccineum]